MYYKFDPTSPIMFPKPGAYLIVAESGMGATSAEKEFMCGDYCVVSDHSPKYVAESNAIELPITSENVGTYVDAIGEIQHLQCNDYFFCVVTAVEGIREELNRRNIDYTYVVPDPSRWFGMRVNKNIIGRIGADRWKDTLDKTESYPHETLVKSGDALAAFIKYNIVWPREISKFVNEGALREFSDLLRDRVVGDGFGNLLHNRADGLHAFIDSYSHLCVRMTDPIHPDHLKSYLREAEIGSGYAGRLACHSEDVVIFSRSDAEAILRILDNVLANSPKGSTDVDVFGDDAISYERLYDVASGEIYSIGTNPDRFGQIMSDIEEE